MNASFRLSRSLALITSMMTPAFACTGSGPGASASESGTETSGTDASSTSGATSTTTTGVTSSGSQTGSATAATTTTSATTEGSTSPTTSSSETDATTRATTNATTDATTAATTGMDSTTDGITGTSTTADADTDTDTGTTTDGCVPSESPEVTCDLVDNDCDGKIDNVDVGKDGICDCLSIGIIGATGFAPNANFEAWLDQQGTTVTRTLIKDKPEIVTAAFLANYDILIVDRIQRGLSANEAAAVESFVKDDGRGLLTLIGYNFDNNNPGPERDRANTVLSPFGLAYQGGYIHEGIGVTPVFDQNHPIGMNIFDVNYIGGIVPVDNGKQGVSAIFATVPQGDAGLAHETDMGGRVIVYGDEWITFDSDWQGYADVEPFWSHMLNWVTPQDFCGIPQ